MEDKPRDLTSLGILVHEESYDGYLLNLPTRVKECPKCKKYAIEVSSTDTRYGVIVYQWWCKCGWSKPIKDRDSEVWNLVQGYYRRQGY